MARTRICTVSPDERKRVALEALCSALRQNEPTVTEIDNPPFPLFQKSNLGNDDDDNNNDCRRLAVALRGNSHVSQLTLDLGYSFSSTDSYRMEEVIRMAEPFLQYLRNTPSTIHTVNLTDQMYHRAPEVERSISNNTKLEQLSRVVLDALAENEFLRLVKIHLPIVSLKALAKFAATTRIQSLEIQLRTFGTAKNSKEIEVAIADAVCSIHTLEHLTLHVVLDIPSLNWETNLLQSILRKQESHGSLKTLSIIIYKSYLSDTAEEPEVFMELLGGLAHYLEASVLLETLEIIFSGISFTKPSLDLFLGGVARSVSLVKLAMNCFFDEDSEIVFCNFFQERRKDGVHSIRELHLENRCHTLFQNSTTGKVMALVLTPPNIPYVGNFRSSVGASLQLLALEWVVKDLDTFFHFLSRNVSTLPKLVIGGVHDLSWYSHLPALIHLRELNIRYIEPGMPDNEWLDPYKKKTNFIDCLRRNGSLQKLTIGEAGYGPFLSDTELRLVQSFCYRNCQTTALLSVQDIGTDGSTHLSLFPILFLVARQAERTAPSTVLAALLLVQDYIGVNQ